MVMLLMYVLVQAINLQGIIITSPNSPPLLIQALYKLEIQNTSLTYLQYTKEILIFIENNPPVFIVDASASLICSHHLDSLSFSMNFILIKIGKPDPRQKRNIWKFFSSPQVFYQTQALQSLVEYFNWESFHLFSSQHSKSLQSAKSLQTNFQQAVFEGLTNILVNLKKVDVALNYIGRLIKPTGIWKLLLFNQQESALQIIQALDKRKMMKKGCGVILNFSGLKTIKEGLIVVAQEGTQTSVDFYDFQIKELQLTLNILQNMYRTESLKYTVSNDILRKKMQEQTINGGRVPKYLILNSILKDTLQEVGTIQEGKVKIFANLTLPGGQSQFTNQVLQILYSQNSGYINHLGQIDIENYIFFGGIRIYIDIINKDESQLQNFELVPIEVNCGSKTFYYEHFKQCFQEYRNSLGSFYIHSFSGVVQDTVNLWRQMGISTFQIALYTQVNELYNKDLYPEIVVTSARWELLFSFLPTFLKYHGWQNIIVVQTQYYKNLDASQSFYKTCQNYRVTVHNTQQTRVIPDNYTSSVDFQQQKWQFKEYFDLQVRIIVILQMWNQILDFVFSLYKIGFRRGDIQIVYISDPKFNAEADSDNFTQEEMDIIRSLFDRSIMISTAEYISEFQYTLKPLVQQALQIDNVETSCFAMDMLQLGAYALDALLTTGRDYQNNQLVNESVRVQRFRGCSDTFSIDSSSNQRRDALYLLGYSAINETTGLMQYFETGTYSAVQNPLMKLFGEFQYSNGSKIPPSDMRFEVWECEFHKELVQNNQKSKMVESVLLSAVVGFSVMFTSVLSLGFRPKQTFEVSQERDVMGLDDMVLLLSIGVQNVQFLMLGPDFSQFNPIFSTLGKYLSISFIDIYSWKFQTFWIYYNGFLAISCGWVLLIFLYFLTNLRYLNTCFDRIFNNLGKKVMPGLAHLFFIPLLVVLVQILVCEQGISEQLQDSFLNRDCNTFCWQGHHLIYVIGSLIVIFIFILTTLTYRYFVSSLFHQRTVQIYPFYNYLKGLLQVFLLTLSSTLKDQVPFVFNILFSLLVAFYLIFSYKFRIYNYKRIQLMQVFCLIGILWSMLLTTVFQIAKEGKTDYKQQIVFGLLQIIGWMFLFFVFMLMFRRELPVFLKLKVRYNVIELFRFMFGKQDLETTNAKVSTKYKVQPSYEE